MRIGDIVKEAYSCSYIQWPTVEASREETVLISSCHSKSCSSSANPRRRGAITLRRVLIICQHAGRLVVSPNNRFTVGQSFGIGHMAVGPTALADHQ